MIAEPQAPTDALPGTSAKVDVMHLRAYHVQRLHHPQDARKDMLSKEQAAEYIATETFARQAERDLPRDVDAEDKERFLDLARWADGYWQQLDAAALAARINAMRVLHGMGEPLHAISQRTRTLPALPLPVRRRRSTSRSPA